MDRFGKYIIIMYAVVASLEDNYINGGLCQGSNLREGIQNTLKHAKLAAKRYAEYACPHFNKGFCLPLEACLYFEAPPPC